MTMRSAVWFSLKMIFPKTEKSSSARKSFFGAIICIAISLIPLVVVLSVSDGMINGMTERIIGLSSSHITAQLLYGADEASNAKTLSEFAEKISEIDGVKNAYPEIAVTVLATSGSYRTGAQIRAVSPTIFSGDTAFTKLFEVKDGDINSFVGVGAGSGGGGNVAASGQAGNPASLRRAIIGTRLSELLNVKAGDTFRIISLQQTPSGIFVPRNVQFTVSAVVSSGYQELDAMWVFIPLEAAYTSLPLANADIAVRIETENAYSHELSAIEKRIAEQTYKVASVYNWSDLNASQFENFSSTRVMLVFIMMLIVLVASVNISAALVMLVMERRREIAILKSIGATSGGVMFSFLIVGLSAGFGGVLAGIPLGIACAINSNKIISTVERIVNIVSEFFYALRGADLSGVSQIKLFNPEYYLTEIQITLSFTGIFLIALFTLVLSLIVSIAPALKAGKEKPLETLRKS